MKIQKEIRQFYDAALIARLGLHTFSKEESHHISKVLRSQLGDDIFITNGKGALVKGEITQIGKSQVIAEVSQVIEQRPIESNLTIAIAPTKNIDRFEWFLEKATEIGIGRIIPIRTKNSERKILKLKRLNKKIVSAMKQSGRLWKPQLDEMITLEELMTKNDFQYKYIAHCHNDIVMRPLNTDTLSSPLVAIGPEGGFTISEVKNAKDNNFVELTLGDYRLRSETAGVVTCQLFSSIL